MRGRGTGVLLYHCASSDQQALTTPTGANLDTKCAFHRIGPVKSAPKATSRRKHLTPGPSTVQARFIRFGRSLRVIRLTLQSPRQNLTACYTMPRRQRLTYKHQHTHTNGETPTPPLEFRKTWGNLFTPVPLLIQPAQSDAEPWRSSAPSGAAA